MGFMQLHSTVTICCYLKVLTHLQIVGGFLGGSVVKNLHANAAKAGVIPGSEDPLRVEIATHSSILAWKIS